MWNSVQSVTGWASLAAFMVAGIVTVLGIYIRRAANKIRLAPEAERANLVRDSLEFFHVNTQGMTREQQREIAIRQIEARAARFRQTALLIIALAVILAIVAIVAIVRQGPPGSVPTPPPRQMGSVDVTVDSSAANYERTTITKADKYVTDHEDVTCAEASPGYEVDTGKPGTHAGLSVAKSNGDNDHREWWDGNCFKIYAKGNGGRGSHASATGITVAVKKLLAVAACGSDSKKGVKVSNGGSNSIPVDMAKVIGNCTGTDLPKPPVLTTTVVFLNTEGKLIDTATSADYEHGHALGGAADFWLSKEGSVTVALKAN